ncbi:MAG: MFS transporter [Dehalococcoidia bacterium]|nr:MFS transporter [Dehalococcoidia bacterium]
MLVVGAVLVHLVVHVDEDLGYSARMAGIAIAVVTAFQILGQIAGGILGDRLNKQFLSVACMAGHVVALLVLAYATALWMVFAFAVLHGTAWGMRAPLMQALRADYFGRTSYGTINGFSSMIVMAGMTLGPLIPGIIADQTGTYTVGFTVLAIMAGIGSVFFILARPPGPPKHPANAPSA